MKGRVQAKVVLSGVGLAPGVRHGRAYKLLPEGPRFYRFSIAAEEVESELARFEEAAVRTLEQLTAIREKFEALLGSGLAQVMDAHMAILKDPCFHDEIVRRIESELESPERALRVVGDQWLSVYRSIPDSFFRERGGDLEEVVDRVSANLLQLSPTAHSPVTEEPLIIVGPSISVSSLAQFDLSRVQGLVSTRGGEASHLNIVARSHEIPVVAGIDDVLQQIETGQELLVDGDQGLVYVEPCEELVATLTGRAKPEVSPRTGPESAGCTTADGEPVLVLTNAEDASEVEVGLRGGAQGVGLFRSEHLYLTQMDAPVNEDDQFRVYRDLVGQLGGRPLAIRTVDIGDEGHPLFARLAGSPEPILGLRGVRFGLRYPTILRSQLRALLRASAEGPLEIILPMISTVDELAQVRAEISELASELRGEGVEVPERIPLGVMIEVPSAVFLLEDLAQEADFFSVGTNDLIQYLMAAGRTEVAVSDIFTPLQPAVLRALAQIQEVSSRLGVPAVVCGEAASSSVFAKVLIGLGFRRFSINPLMVAEVRNRLSRVVAKDCAQLASRLLEAATIDEVQRTIAEAEEVNAETDPVT